jgi:hypothetical protein
MSIFYPTMSTEERRSVLASDLDGDLQGGRWFGAACMAGAMLVLGADPCKRTDPSTWRVAALRELGWTEPSWLERAVNMEADDDIRRLILLLRIDEAGCGIGWLGEHPAAIIAEMDAVCMVIASQPELWAPLGTAAVRRLEELEAAPFPNPAYRVWKAVFRAWRATATVPRAEEARS